MESCFSMHIACSVLLAFLAVAIVGFFYSEKLRLVVGNKSNMFPPKFPEPIRIYLHVAIRKCMQDHGTLRVEKNLKCL